MSVQSSSKNCQLDWYKVLANLAKAENDDDFLAILQKLDAVQLQGHLHSHTAKSVPLLDACNKLFFKSIGYLLEQGASPSESLLTGKTPLMIICSKKFSENQLHTAMRTLIESNADLNAVDFLNRTALHYAYIAGNIKLVRELIRSGASEDVHDIFNKKPKDYLKDKLSADKAD